jgi:CRP-like cAMP-binding protein
MEDIRLLKKLEFFKDLKTMELQQINKILQRSTFRAGEVIVKEGTACDAFYIVKDGSVKITKKGNELATFGSKEPIGEISFIDKGLRSATVTALTDVVLINIPSDSFSALMEQDKNLSNNIIFKLEFS